MELADLKSDYDKLLKNEDFDKIRSNFEMNILNYAGGVIASTDKLDTIDNKNINQYKVSN